MKNMVVKNVKTDEYGSILEIELENGYLLLPDEDTGGELALLIIEDVVLKKGDIISFDHFFDTDDEIWGLEKIQINDMIYDCKIESEGGNTSTYLRYTMK